MRLSGIRKVFVLGDLHLGVKNNSLEWSDIQAQYLLDEFPKQVDALGFDPETDILVQVGDWNHTRESTNTRIYKISIQIAEYLTSKFKRGVYVILGNHDVYYKDRTDTHSLYGFNRMFSNFHVFEKPQALQINSHDFLLLPWEEDLGEIRNSLTLHHSAKYIFCHAEIKGISLGKNTHLEHGLDLDELANFKKVYSGHIHLHQRKNNVLYVGTPYEMDRGDRTNPKGFYVLDVSGPEISEKFVPNEVSPKHLKFDVFEVLQFTPQQAKALFKNNFVDISMESEFSKRFPISRFTEMVKDFGQRRLEFMSYSKNQAVPASQAEAAMSYEYNIFTVMNEKLTQMNLNSSLSNQVTEKFKNLYDTLKNTKEYDQ